MHMISENTKISLKRTKYFSFLYNSVACFNKTMNSIDMHGLFVTANSQLKHYCFGIIRIKTTYLFTLFITTLTQFMVFDIISIPSKLWTLFLNSNSLSSLSFQTNVFTKISFLKLVSVQNLRLFSLLWSLRSFK